MNRIFFLLLFISITINASAIYFRHLGIQDGLSQLSVMSIYQDELGRMWFGTLEGLNMYDGKDITVFKPNDLKNTQQDFLLGNDNRELTGDKNKNIYFQSDYALVRFNIEEQKFTQLRQDRVRAITYQDNLLYYTVNDSIFIWDQQKHSFLFHINEPGLIPQRIIIDQQKTIWIGTKTGLYIKKKEKPVEYILPDQDIFDIFQDSKKRIWIATYESGIFIFHPDGTREQILHYPQNPNSLAYNQVRCFEEDNHGNIWIGTFTGLNRYNPDTGQFSMYQRDILPGSLRHNSVFSLYKGQQGTIWVGTYYGGVHYFNPENDLFSLFSDNPERKDCLSFPFVGNMVEDDKGNVWICTEGGGLNFFNRKTKQFKHYKAGTGRAIAHDNLKSICYNAKYNKLFLGLIPVGFPSWILSRKRLPIFLFTHPPIRPVPGW